jgi:iron complex outermembrane receptor protein
MTKLKWALASRLFAGTGVLLACSQAWAQSTATSIEEGSLEEVIVSGETINDSVGLIQHESVPKSRSTVSAEYIKTQTAGQSVIQSLNLVPGVNFTNSDPYGSSGGNLRMRSFDGPRISLMLDGIQLNDTGNYAMYTNQQVDPEIVEKVTVNLGTSDVDSPTASATGGTINIVTREPSQDAGMVVQPSFGSDSYQRYFIMADSGAFGPWDTTSYLAASYQQYDKFKGPGELEKIQVNGRIHQQLGEEDFISLAFHGNRNRNDFYRNLSLADIAANGYDFDNDATCNKAGAAPAAGTAQNEGAAGVTCTNYYNVRTNPSDTANIRMQSSFGLTDSLRLTVDPSFQYTLANGGGYTVTSEGDRRLRGNTSAAGVDLNGDGDVLDSIGLYTPNNTNTRRYSLNSSLLWALNDDNLLRLAYTLDYGKHRQTGQFGFLEANGDPENVFGGRKGTPVKSADGADLRGRDRYSVARLNQVALSYTGQMLDDKMRISAGLRAPKFERELNQNCYTQVNGTTPGTQYCTTQTPTATANARQVTFAGVASGGVSTLYLRPYSGEKKYDKILPNLGVSLQPWGSEHMFYASYASGLSAPRTDNLYNVQILDVEPEETDSFDVGYRFQTSSLTASAAVWKSDYKNRIVTSFDPDLGFSVDRNVGPVDLWGLDLAVGAQVVEGLSLYGSASYNNSEVQENLLLSAGTPLPTKGKQLVETPEWTFSTRAEYTLGPVVFGVQGKFVDERFSTDVNDQAAPSYTVFDADLRYSFSMFDRESFVQLNVINLADKEYLGSVATSRFSTTPSTLPLYAVGAPRTFQLTMHTSF